MSAGTALQHCQAALTANGFDIFVAGDAICAGQVFFGIEHVRAAIEVLQDFAFESEVNGIHVRKEPIGVVAAITPWNWPLYQITAKVLSDSFQGLATESAINNAATVVGLYAANRVLSYGNHQTTANLCEAWLLDQMKNNVVEIRQGGSTMRFTKTPYSGYNPPPGQTLKLTTVSGNFRLKNSKGIFYDFDSSGNLDTWSDAHGNVVDFSYASGKLSSVACKIGGSTTSRTLSFTYTGNHITSVSDSASRSISYQYSGNGELTRYTNPDANSVNYEYDATNKGQLKKIYSPIDVVNPVLTVVYDSIGRTKQQIDANDCTWDFYRATYRNEVQPPSQTDPNGLTRRFGSYVWTNPENRTVTSVDGQGHLTTSTYNAQARPESITSPAGTTAEFQ